MRHLHSDLVAITRRITELVGSDRVISSHEEDASIQIRFDSLEALDEFAEHFDGSTPTWTNRVGAFEMRTSTAVIEGIDVTATGSGLVVAGRVVAS